MNGLKWEKKERGRMEATSRTLMDKRKKLFGGSPVVFLNEAHFLRETLERRKEGTSQRGRLIGVPERRVLARKKPPDVVERKV